MTQLRVLNLEGFVHTHAFPPNLLYLRLHYQHLEINQICKLQKVVVLDLEGFPHQDFPNIAEEVHVTFFTFHLYKRTYNHLAND